MSSYRLLPLSGITHVLETELVDFFDRLGDGSDIGRFAGGDSTGVF